MCVSKYSHLDRVHVHVHAHDISSSFLSCFYPKNQDPGSDQKDNGLFFWDMWQRGIACLQPCMGWLADDDMGGGVSLLPPPLPRTPSTRPPQNEYRDILVLHVYCCFWSLGSETLLVEADARLPRNRGKKGRDIFSTAASGTKSEKWKNKGVHGLGVMKQGVDQICRD